MMLQSTWKHTLYLPNTLFEIFTYLINVNIHLLKIQNLSLQSMTEYFAEHLPNKKTKKIQ
jgi:hypothetical protein